MQNKKYLYLCNMYLSCNNPVSHCQPCWCPGQQISSLWSPCWSPVGVMSTTAWCTTPAVRATTASCPTMSALPPRYQHWLTVCGSSSPSSPHQPWSQSPGQCALIFLYWLAVPLTDWYCCPLKSIVHVSFYIYFYFRIWIITHRAVNWHKLCE